ncbi:MAG: exonuclease SbcC, partial [Colwellia sp.]
MIFSKFLKKKWQHKNSIVRVEAINSSLSVDDAAQRDIIIALVKNDDNENVRRAGLIKLASFQSWLNQSQENTMAKV